MTTFGLDAPRTTRDEAVELCIHHLRLAWMYFDAVPDDGNSQLLEELSRVMAFAAAALKYHEELKRRA